MAEPLSNTLSTQEVRKVARLARLSLNDAETLDMQRSLSSILTYVHKLDELDVQDVPATAHAVDLSVRLREDEVQAGLPVEVGLRNAPERLGDGFGVPKIIE